MRKSQGLVKLFTSRIFFSSKRRVNIKRSLIFANAQIRNRKRRRDRSLILKIFLVGIFFLPFFRTVPDKAQPVQIIETPKVPSVISIFDKDGNLLFKDTVGSTSSYKRTPHAESFCRKK